MFRRSNVVNRCLFIFRYFGASAEICAKSHGGGDNYQVFDDILAFQCWSHKSLPSDLREQYEWHNRGEHVWNK